MIVIDASAIFDYLLDPEPNANIRRALTSSEGPVVVPHHCDVEVVSALRSAIRRGQVTPRVAEETLAFYLHFPLERFDLPPLLDRVLALRDNFSPYDAAYVALAEALEAPFLTADARLADAVNRFTDVEALVA